MIKINVKYLGDLHCQVTHGPSGQSFITDAPVDNNGKGEFISPTDLAAASIGSCIATIMAIKARDMAIDIKGLEIDVTKEMEQLPYRRIKKLTVEITFPIRLDEKQLKIMTNVVNTCPVTRSLKEEVEVVPIFKYKE